MKTVIRLNTKKENEILGLLATVDKEISEAFIVLNRLPDSVDKDDLYESVLVLSHAFHSIRTQPFRVHNSGELPQLEQSIDGLNDFISTRLKFLVIQINELSQRVVE